MKYQKFTSGVYCIYTKTGVPLYVGSSRDLDKRYKDHLDKLSNNVHSCTQLQHYVDINGIENVLFVPIFLCHESDILINEMKFINFIRPAFNNQFNGGLKITIEDSGPIELLRKNFNGRMVDFDTVKTCLDHNGYPGLNARNIGRILKQVKRVRLRKENNKLYYQF